MTVKIKEANGISLKLWFPTSLVNSKIGRFLIKKCCDEKTSKIIINLIPTIHKSMIKYIKKNGRFILVDFLSSDGDMIIVKV